MRKEWMIAIALVAACRGSSKKMVDGKPADTNNVDALSDGCNNTYTPSSIATMRQATTPGCTELDNVIVIGKTPSADAPKLYVQDAAGGNFSAIEAYCDNGSMKHPCPAGTMAAAIPLGHKVTLKGTYIKAATNPFEEFYIFSFTDNGAGTPPAPGTATLADLQRNSTNYGLAFQKVTFTLPSGGNNDWLMYDFTPAELSRTATSCPYVFGWGMIPKAVGAATTMQCTTNTMQPTSGTANNAEIFIDTRFYNGFTYNSDCKCAGMYSNTVPTMASTIPAGSTVQGILLSSVPYMATTGFFALAPQVNADLPITNTAAAP